MRMTEIGGYPDMGGHAAKKYAKKAISYMKKALECLSPDDESDDELDERYDDGDDMGRYPMGRFTPTAYRRRMR